MVAITSRRKRLDSLGGLRRFDWLSVAMAAGLGAVVLVLGRSSGWWPLAMAVVAAIELWRWRAAGRARAVKTLAGLVLPVVAGLAAVLVVAVNIRFVSQAAVVVLYVLWRWWWSFRPQQQTQLGHLLAVQALLFEGIFLAAAVWRPGDWLGWLFTLWLVLIWLGAFWPSLAVLRAREERSAGVLAAAWALVAVEVSWVLLLWLFTYTSPGGFILVPQPTVVLVALAYCFGSIYASARGGQLSRGRLVEYLLIGLILILMVVGGTSWHGSI